MSPGGGSFEVAAEALDAPAGLLHVLGLGRIGNAKGGTEAERAVLGASKSMKAVEALGASPASR